MLENKIKEDLDDGNDVLLRLTMKFFVELSFLYLL